MEIFDMPPNSPRWQEALPVLAQLRPHLTPAMLEDVLREATPQGLRFLGAFSDDTCLGVAGWRIMTNTSVGRKLYIDDLVTAKESRSRGVGARLLDELKRRALDVGCAALELDSGVQRHGAHRFYLREHMVISSHHFSLTLAHASTADTEKNDRS